MATDVGNDRAWLHEQGYKLLRIQYRGKKPALPEWKSVSDAESQSDDEFQKMFPTGSQYNTAAIIPEDQIVLDFETNEAARNAVWAIPDLVQTLHVKTGNGEHFYCKRSTAAGLENGMFSDAEGHKQLELRMSNAERAHYCVVPPSTHGNGNEYVFLNRTDAKEIPNLEGRLLDFITNQQWTFNTDKKPAKEPKLQSRIGSLYDDIKARITMREVEPNAPWHGDTVRWKCPKHGDSPTHPAPCWLNSQDGFFRCHSVGCGERGDVIHYVAVRDGLTDSQAAAKLAEQLGLIKPPTITVAPQQLATKASPEVIKLLHNSALFDAIDQDLSRLIVGENKTRKAIALFTFMRLVKNRGAGACSNLLVNSGASAGKDYITRTICGLHPDSQVKSFSRVSPTALGRWMANTKDFTWDGKLCRLSDISTDLVRSDAFKVFLSEDEAALLTGKNKTGQTTTEELTVQGKPVLIATTANAAAGEELLARFSVIELDESVAQNKAVVRWKLEQATGAGKKLEISKTVRDAIDYLGEVEVVVQFAPLLAEHIPVQAQRVRRDIDRLLNLIRASAALYQFQRQRDEQGRVIAEGQDYAIAAEALTCIKSGTAANLTRAQRKVLEACRELVAAKGESDEHHNFTRQELYAAKPVCGFRQLFDHLGKLAELGLLHVDYRDATTKPTLAYSLVEAPLNNLQLPSFQDLTLKTTLSTLPTHTSLSSLSSQSPPVNAVNEDNAACKDEGYAGDANAV